MKELIEIQRELKAPKNQYNHFGNYNYRSCEDILEAVKPLLAKYGCLLTISDKMIEIGGRVYVEATAKIEKEGQEKEVSANARETESKKGMDSSQITGSASSYARKYALNGLFLIDDNKDSDTNEQYKQDNKNGGATPKQSFNEFAEQAAPTIEECNKYIDSQVWSDQKKEAMKKSSANNPILRGRIMSGDVK